MFIAVLCTICVVGSLFGLIVLCACMGATSQNHPQECELCGFAVDEHDPEQLEYCNAMIRNSNKE